MRIQGGIIMKKLFGYVQRFGLKVVSLAAILVATGVANRVCFFDVSQPVQPTGMDKFRKNM